MQIMNANVLLISFVQRFILENIGAFFQKRFMKPNTDQKNASGRITSLS